MEKQLTLHIDGMSCMGCVRNLTEKLKNITGVNQATVSLAEKNAVIMFDPQQTDAAALTQCVIDAGFDVI